MELSADHKSSSFSGSRRIVAFELLHIVEDLLFHGQKKLNDGLLRDGEDRMRSQFLRSA
jgi:hypothetical protein